MGCGHSLSQEEILKFIYYLMISIYIISII
jgi:hypothetical protein